VATSKSKAKDAGCGGTGEDGATLGYEADLWRMAGAPRGAMDAAEYKHVVLGLVFLRHITDAFEELHAKLEEKRPQGADSPLFWVPPEARWVQVKKQARQPTIGRLVDGALEGIERDNPVLKSVLPKEYATTTRMRTLRTCSGGSTRIPSWHSEPDHGCL